MLQMQDDRFEEEKWAVNIDGINSNSMLANRIAGADQYQNSYVAA